MRHYHNLTISWVRLEWTFILLPIILFVSCGSSRDQLGAAGRSIAGNPQVSEATSATNDGLLILQMPELEVATNELGRIKVIATISIIGDIVSQIGGEFVDLVVLIKPGQDPHSFVSSVNDLRVVAESDVIFVAGWDLESGLIGDLSSVSDSPQVPVSAGIRPRLISEVDKSSDSDRSFADPDPHTWLNPKLVIQWVTNISMALSELDPGNRDAYQLNAKAYIEKLNQLIDLYDSTVATMGIERRKLVTNHNSLGYFADAYDFKIVGSIIPASSALAEPSARELAVLVRLMEEEELCTIFTDSTANNQLATAVADELDYCAVVHIVALYTGALGKVGSEADTYIKMMEKNIEAIEQNLR